jgi:hypothetical protein
MCLWCYHHILEEAAKDSTQARCPNCRTDYDQNKIQMQHIDAAALEEEKRKLREKEKPKGPGGPQGGGGLGTRSTAHLANMRIVQQNLVYAVGIPLDICTEETLKSNEFFGSFGKTIKVSVNRSNQYASAMAKHGPTGSAYVTFKRAEDALKCIKALDGAAWVGKPIKACFGTTKYCNAFLKSVVCNNPDCLYLHDLADEEDCLTKEEVAAGLLPARFLAMGATNTFKPRLTIHSIPNPQTAAAQAAAAAAAAAGQSQAQIAAAAAAAGGVSTTNHANGNATAPTATATAIGMTRPVSSTLGTAGSGSSLVSGTYSTGSHASPPRTISIPLSSLRRNNINNNSNNNSGGGGSYSQGDLHHQHHLDQGGAVNSPTLRILENSSHDSGMMGYQKHRQQSNDQGSWPAVGGGGGGGGGHQSTPPPPPRHHIWEAFPLPLLPHLQLFLLLLTKWSGLN